MDPTKRERLKKLIGYPAFFLAAFVLMLYLTFPYDAVAELARNAAKQNKIDLSIGSVGPGFLGIRAKKVGITMPRKPGEAGEPTPIMIDSVSARPMLLPPGISYSASVFGGTVDGRVGVLGDAPHVRVQMKGVDLAKANSKAALGLDLGGRLNGVIDVDLHKQDSSKTTGRVAFTGEDVIINGGTVSNYDLPKVDLGRLEAELKLDKGQAQVQTFKANGKDVEASIEGNITLAQKLMFSTLALKLKFKPSEDFLRKNSFIQTGLNFAMRKDPGGFYATNIERMLGNPSFRPMR